MRLSAKIDLSQSQPGVSDKSFLLFHFPQVSLRITHLCGPWSVWSVCENNVKANEGWTVLNYTLRQSIHNECYVMPRGMDSEL